MRRVIGTTESTDVGRCIYCGTSEGNLSNEHITPFGLNGRLVLLRASCAKCAKITSSIERRILRGMLFAARAELGTRSRGSRGRAKDREQPHPMLIERDGKIEEIQALWRDHWKIIQLPIFDLPAYIEGRHYSSGIYSTSMDTFELSERGTEIALRHGADRVLPPKFCLVDYARFIAKMAYGYAVERYGLNTFESVFVPPSILGNTDDVGRWVGCTTVRELPVRQCFVSVGYKILPENQLVVRIKMFPMFDGAEYVVVIGKLKDSYRRLLPGPW